MSSPFGGGGIPKQLQMGAKMDIFDNFGLAESQLMANISKTVSRSITYQLELNISSTRVSKNVTAPGESIISKNMLGSILQHHL